MKEGEHKGQKHKTRHIVKAKKNMPMIDGPSINEEKVSMHNPHTPSKFSNYLLRHIAMMKNAFKCDKVMLKLLLADVLFIFTILISYSLIYFFWVHNVLRGSYFFELLYDAQNPLLSPEEVILAWNSFITNVILIVVLVVLLFMIIIGIYSAISHLIITKNRLSAKLFLNFVYIYSILTLLLFIFIIAILYLSKNINLVAWGIVFFMFIYLYLLLIFYLVTNDGAISGIFKHGFKSALKLHDTLPPIIIASIVLPIVFAILFTIFGRFQIIAFAVLMFSFLYMLNWMKRYLHHMIHS